MKDILITIAIYRDTYKKFKDYLKRQSLKPKDAFEILMNYVMDRQVNLKKIEDQKANYLSTEFETTQGKISNLHNTYVSFQRTFEHKNKTDAMLNLVTNYEILRQITAPTRYEKAIKQLSKSYLMTQLISHPQQKLLSKKGGLSIIYKDIAEPELLKQSQNYDFSFQNYAIIWQILALTEELCSWTITQIQSQNTPINIGANHKTQTANTKISA